MKQLLLFSLLFAGLVTYHASGQATKSVQPRQSFISASFFESESPLELTLVSDFKNIRSKKKKGVFQPGSAIVQITPTESVMGGISIAARGEFRREECQMPSLMVDFRGKDSSALAGLKKLKIVCGCNTSDYSEELLLMEYLTYKLYNMLTPMSFKVRLAKVIYKDVNDRMKPYTQFAFFIEDVDVLAKRNKCREYQNKPAFSQLSDRNQMTIVYLFQYMIGNTDWSVPNFHNIKLIQQRADTNAKPFVVPYDFDFAGIINAPYAIPNPEFSIEKVTDRLYRGQPRNLEELEITLNIFRSKKNEMLQMIKNFEYLKEKPKRNMTDYLEDFFTFIENKKNIKSEFVAGGRN